jgi:hypothetical protein
MLFIPDVNHLRVANRHDLLRRKGKILNCIGTSALMIKSGTALMVVRRDAEFLPGHSAM